MLLEINLRGLTSGRAWRPGWWVTAEMLDDLPHSDQQPRVSCMCGVCSSTVAPVDAANGRTPPQSPMPASRARITAWMRSATPSLAKIAVSWLRIVFSDTPSCLAICALLSPVDSRTRISLSRTVS